MAEPTKPTPHHRPPPSGPHGRAHVSPLGGQIFSEVRDSQQIYNERRNRAQTPRPPEPPARKPRQKS
jgi:hypothetical protein